MKPQIVTLVIPLLLAAACKDKKPPGPDLTAAVTGVVEQTPEDLSKVLATIDGVDITVQEFQDRINKQSPYIRARYTSIEQRKEFLENLVRFEVLAGQARREGFDKDPEVVRTMKQVMIQKLMRKRLEDGIRPEDVSEEEMRAYYDEHQGEFNKPEQVRVSAIIMKDKAAADNVARLAKGERGETHKGFRELVAEYSVDGASRKQGGDLRYFTRDTDKVPAEVVKAAFSMQSTGEVVGPIFSAPHFYILKQTGRRKAVSKEFDEVKRQLRNRLYREKRADAQKTFVDGLEKKATIEIFEDELAKVVIDTSPTVGAPHPHAPPGPSPFLGDPDPSDAPKQLESREEGVEAAEGQDSDPAQEATP